MKGEFEKKDEFDLMAKRIKGFRGFPMLFHLHCEVLFVIKGEVNMTVDGYERTLRAGEIATVFPYIVHSYESAPNAELYVLLFNPGKLVAFEGDLLRKKPVNPYSSSFGHLLPLIERVCALASEEGAVKHETAMSYLCAIVGELLCTMPLCDVEEVSENMIKPILLYCSDHFADEDISIKKIADELYVSTSYVSKVFSTKLKYGLRKYVNELRISKAKDLLSKTDLKIIDVMLECGFRNQSSFNRVFFEACGLSPSEYRRKKKNKKNT